ncbi:MAG: hypothetical protein ACFFB0_00195 [Promethearchaeota archaeon]
MTTSIQEEFIEKVIKLIDRWSFEMCAFCDNGSMVSIEGMLDFKCSRCGKRMTPVTYLGEIAKEVFKYRDQVENSNNE